MAGKEGHGVVHVAWYATVFRGDKFADALTEIAAVALRYGATSYDVYRGRDDPYKFLQTAAFEDRLDWERYWDGPEFIAFRAPRETGVPTARNVRRGVVASQTNE